MTDTLKGECSGPECPMNLHIFFALVLSLANSIKRAEEENVMKSVCKDADSRGIPESH